MKHLTIQIINEEGMHMRPAKDFIELVTPYKSQIIFEKNSTQYNGKSMLHILKASIRKDDIVHINILGTDEDIVFEKVLSFVLKFSRQIDTC